VHEYFRKGMKTVVLRPAAIYGPGDPERFYMIFKRVEKGVFPIFGSGKTLYHPLYIDNLIDAFICAMESGKGDGEAFLIADEDYIEIEDLVRKVGEVLRIRVKTPHFPLWPLIFAGHVVEKACRPFKIKPPIFPRRVDWYRQNRAFKIEKAKRMLGYRPKIGIDEGLRRTAEWYVTEGYIDRPSPPLSSEETRLNLDRKRISG
jgi:2-alkyl-3-oxoalkanoate reductase